MRVTLLEYSNCRENLADVGAATCIGKQRYIHSDRYNKHLKAAIDSGHVSVIEHLPLTFLVEDVSRALLCQITRHRHFSFSVQSQKYCKINTSNANWFCTPDTIKVYTKEDSINSKYQQLMYDIAQFYQEMLDADIPAEDARMILPNACHTFFLVSMNARSFVEAASKRLCNRAQWEIRELFQLMTERIKDIYPQVYELAKPNCKTIGCQEKKPCK